MFGLNDNNSQVPGDNQTANAPALSQPNPFADAAVRPAPLPAPPAHLTPIAPPVLPPSTSVPPAPAEPLAGNDDLFELKEQALTSLQPLVSHLDQSPEEKFRTTMMLIQATDNPALVKEAYAAANQITDEKARAQALLDVVNEINYFTQHGAETEDKPQV